MRLVLRYQSIDGTDIRIKSGFFSRRRRHDNEAVSIVSRYAIEIYNEALDTRGRPMQLHESYEFRSIPKKDGERIKAGLRILASQLLNPYDLENALEMFLEDLFNED